LPVPPTSKKCNGLAITGMKPADREVSGCEKTVIPWKGAEECRWLVQPLDRGLCGCRADLLDFLELADDPDEVAGLKSDGRVRTQEAMPPSLEPHDEAIDILAKSAIPNGAAQIAAILGQKNGFQSEG